MRQAAPKPCQLFGLFILRKVRKICQCKFIIKDVLKAASVEDVSTLCTIGETDIILSPCLNSQPGMRIAY